MISLADGSKKRMIIGVVAAQVADIEQRRILQGIIEQSQIHNCDVAVFSNVYNPNESPELFIAENKIYELVLSNELDGIILISEAFINNQLRDNIKSKLMKLKNIPIIIIGTLLDDFSSDNVFFINTNDDEDIESVTDHLIDVHGFDNIDIITGYEQLEASHIRVDGYRRSLEKHGISYNPDKVYYGNFWMNSGEELAQKYLNHKIAMPQAVVCTNDYMAFGIIDELIDNNVRVPEDITVVGYEYVHERMYHHPILTTFQRNRKAVGQEAVRLLWSKLTKKKYSGKYSLDGNIVYGNSCSCGISSDNFKQELKTVRTEQIYTSMNLFSQLETKLTECRSIHDFINVIRNFTYLIRNVKEVYFCLFENWYKSFSHYEFVNCYKIIDYNDNVNNNMLINPLGFSKIFSCSDVPLVYYFNPLFFSDRMLGYIILQYDSPDTYDHVFRNWLKSVSNVLEFLRMKNDIQYLMQYKNMSEHYDTVTGLYNNVGFESALNFAVSMPQTKSDVIVMILETQLFSPKFQLDMQENKIANIKAVADAVNKLSANDKGFCARINESTFAFAEFGNFKQEHLKLLSDKLETALLRKSGYIEEFGIDSYVISCELTERDSFSFKRIMSSLAKSNEKKIHLLAEVRSQRHFDAILKFRSNFYSNPLMPDNKEQLCKFLDFSPGYFRNIYKKYFSVSYNQDRILCRIFLAKSLLCSTSLSVTGIAEQCGYKDEKYFMRIFQQNAGMTPTAYREKMNVF